MNPGRELDALIAEKVMGWEWYSKEKLNELGYNTNKNLLLPSNIGQADGNGWCAIESHISPYSTDISAAWEVVEKFSRKNGRSGGGPIINISHDGNWHCDFGGGDGTLGSGAVAQSETAPHAICLAALKACGVELNKTKDD